MQHRRWFDDDWWNRREGDRREGAAETLDELRDMAVQAALLVSACLALASLVPPVLVAPLLRELLLFSAAFVSLAALLRGEALTMRHFNRQDVALLLLALAMTAGFFIDPAAVEAMTQSAGSGGG